MSFRLFKDKFAGDLMAVLVVLSLLLVVAMGFGLYMKSAPIFEDHSLWDLLSDSDWQPMKNKFGFLPFLAGTISVTVVAIVIALPISLLMAIFLSEYSKKYVKKYVYPLLDILAGLPSVIYGVWGTLLIVPLIGDYIVPHFEGHSSGYTVLAGGVVLSVMILPLLVSLFIEIFSNVPVDLREASLSVGATKWQTVKFVLLRKSTPGIIAAIVLAISRTLGETIAVLMVCGNIPIVPNSLLDACYPLPALIANNYGEMLSLPLYEAALMFAAFILFFVVVIFNLFSRIILHYVNKK